MTTRMSVVIEHLRRTSLLYDAGEWTDGQLLERFVSRGETAALEVLVRRHASMVWGVCRRILPNDHDAEDAFQATFLVLVRKASSVMPRALVGNWLYGVAHQTAVKARATTAKRRARERQVVDMPEPAGIEQDVWSDLQPLLDQELSRLPEKYRAAIVLCDLEGKTRKQAARQLGCPEGTLAARLARGRVMLAKRLAARGLAVSGGALAGVLSEQAASAGVPVSVLSSTMKAVTVVAAGQAAAGVISANAVALAEGVLKIMLLNRIKVAAVTLLLLAVLGGGAVGLTHQTRAAGADDPPTLVPSRPIPFNHGDAGPPKAPKPKPVDPKTESDKKPRTSLEMDHPMMFDGPLPDFAQDRPNSIDGLWEDFDNKGGWFRIYRNTILWHPALSQLSELGRKENPVKPIIEQWACRYNLTPTPMTIDIFYKKGTARGIFVLEGNTLFIALAQIGKARPTTIQRDDKTNLLVLKQVDSPQREADRARTENEIAAFYERTGHPGAAAFWRQIVARKEKAKEERKEETKDKPVLVIHAVLEKIDANNAVITAEAVSDRAAGSLLKLLSFVVSDKEADKESVARTVERAMRFVSKTQSKLVNIPVRSDAKITRGDKTLKLKDLQAGRVVSLQLAGDPDMGLVIVGIRVVERPSGKKP
jgi:RNA polymerase sigma factor (sigma-70 family)